MNQIPCNMCLRIPCQCQQVPYANPMQSQAQLSGLLGDIAQMQNVPGAWRGPRHEAAMQEAKAQMRAGLAEANRAQAQAIAAQCSQQWIKPAKEQEPEKRCGWKGCQALATCSLEHPTNGLTVRFCGPCYALALDEWTGRVTEKRCAKGGHKVDYAFDSDAIICRACDERLISGEALNLLGFRQRMIASVDMAYEHRANALADRCQTLEDENTKLHAELSRLQRRMGLK